MDPKGYVKEINSFRHFGWNSKSCALEIIAITDWGWKYSDAWFCYPIPVFPHYLFNTFAGSRQDGGQVPTKPDYLTQAGGDVQNKCTEAWVWMSSILQFRTDEVSIADGVLFGGLMCPVSTLAECVMSTINPVLEPGYRVSWKHIISRTLLLRKHLFNATSEEERQIWHQPIPVAGILSDLEVAMEECYNQDFAAKKSTPPQ